MARLEPITFTITIKYDQEITLWQAIKIRIAGKRFADAIIKKLHGVIETSIADKLYSKYYVNESGVQRK
jgi:hypothetical protein